MVTSMTTGVELESGILWGASTWPLFRYSVDVVTAYGLQDSAVLTVSTSVQEGLDLDAASAQSMEVLIGLLDEVPEMAGYVTLLFHT
jgi:hypothetical protein